MSVDVDDDGGKRKTHSFFFPKKPPLGIDPEFGTHSHIRGLSGGQKVKCVIAAAMWQSPHMLILDEPTNYLDREALGESFFLFFFFFF